MATTLVQWVYTDTLKILESTDDVDGFTLDLMKAASSFKLPGKRVNKYVGKMMMMNSLFIK